MKIDDPVVVAEEYATRGGLVGRRTPTERRRVRIRRSSRFSAVAEVAPRACSRSAGGPGEACRSGSREEIGCGGRRGRCVAADGRADACPRGRCARRRCPGAASCATDVRLRLGRLDALSTCPISNRALAELARVLRPGGRLVAVTNAPDALCGAAGARRRLRPGAKFQRRERAPSCLDGISRASSAATPAAAIDDFRRPRCDARVRRGVARERLGRSELPSDFELPLRGRRAPLVYVAEKQRDPAGGADRAEAERGGAAGGRDRRACPRLRAR